MVPAILPETLTLNFCKKVKKLKTKQKQKQSKRKKRLLLLLTLVPRPANGIEASKTIVMVETSPLFHADVLQYEYKWGGGGGASMKTESIHTNPTLILT